MSIKSKNFKPRYELRKYIDDFWFFENDTGKIMYFPVVPDGCSDIIFYLGGSEKLDGTSNTFISGIMESAQITAIPDKVKLFGIRFKPGTLAIILNVDMSKIANKNSTLNKINNKVFKDLEIEQTAECKDIVLRIENKLMEVFEKVEIQDNFFEVIKNIKDDPQVTISELAIKYGFSIKNLERIFNKKIGLTPKKFACIIKFQKAHKRISKEGLGNLLSIALSTGYFDQAHFNHDYKKITGSNPSSEIMSILYNQ